MEENTAETKVVTKSVARLLVELKTLGKQIEKLASNLNKAVGIKVNKKMTTGETPDEFTAQALKNYSQVRSLIEYRNTIKYLIVKSNAESIVNIAGKNMTVAEAIEKKASINFNKLVVETLRSSQYNATRLYESLQAKAEKDLDNFVCVSHAAKDTSKINKEDYEKIAGPYRESHEPHLCDPLNVNRVIELEEADITEFMKEVDISLSESNARTLVVVPA